RPRFRVEGDRVLLESGLWPESDTVRSLGLEPVREQALTSFGGGQGDPGRTYWALLPGLLVAGAGLGISSAAATTSILSGAPENAQGSASGVNNAAREVGGAIGIAAMGSLLNSTYSSNVDADGLPAEAARTASDSFVGAQQVAGGLGSRGRDLALSAQGAFVDGFHSALYLGAGALGLAAAVLLEIGPRVGQVLDERDEPEEPQDEEGAGTPAGDRVLTAA
nr:hypothetical protein [Solirubrobacterales bacterium]